MDFMSWFAKVLALLLSLGVAQPVLSPTPHHQQPVAPRVTAPRPSPSHSVKPVPAPNPSPSFSTIFGMVTNDWHLAGYRLLNASAFPIVQPGQTVAMRGVASGADFMIVDAWAWAPSPSAG